MNNINTPARQSRCRLAAHHGVLFPDAAAVRNLQVLSIASAFPAVHKCADGAGVHTGNFTTLTLLDLPARRRP